MLEYATAYCWVRFNWRKPVVNATWIKGADLIEKYPNQSINPNKYYCHISETYAISDYDVRWLLSLLDVSKFKKAWDFENMYEKIWWNNTAEE